MAEIYTKLLNISLWAIAAVTFTACELDNYDEPSSMLTGKVVDGNGNPIGVQGSRGKVSLQLWQPSYPLTAGAIDVYVGQDGTFSAKLFNGDYVLKLRDGNGPWEHTGEELAIHVGGNTAVTFPVKPYYTLSNVTYSLSGTTLSATFTITEATAKGIDKVFLLVNSTQFVDEEDQVKREEGNAVVGTQTVTIDLSGDWDKHKFLYARVGLRINGVEHGLYDTQVEKIK
ncbi:hypothetical protein AGMMS49965_23190 [Bacteroidia bacterium]|nr:hypothetical protein AGMMS49965_23190 [Bacteroidia bacterium]